MDFVTNMQVHVRTVCTLETQFFAGYSTQPSQNDLAVHNNYLCTYMCTCMHVVYMILHAYREVR